LVAKDGNEALEILSITNPDIILSDIKMANMDGLTLTKKIRSTGNTVPIVLLSSYSDQQTLLKAANLGIDGYILKPIELSNLLETFDNIFKRKLSNRKSFTFQDGLIYNLLTEELHQDAKIIPLGKKEKVLLKLFIDNYDIVLSKEEIIANIWEFEDVTDSALKNLLNRLRGKIGYDLIILVKGSGWKLNLQR
jgi:two-component system, OmpR family, response regulator VanR